jgi:hypothetical protein
MLYKLLRLDNNHFNPIIKFLHFTNYMNKIEIINENYR